MKVAGSYNKTSSQNRRLISGINFMLIILTFSSCEQEYAHKDDGKVVYLKKDSSKVAAEREVFLAAEMNARIKILVLPSIGENKDTVSFKNVLCISYQSILGIDGYFHQFLKETNKYNVIDLKDSAYHRFYANPSRTFKRSDFKDFEEMYKPDIVVLSELTTINYLDYTYTYKVKIYSPATGQEINSINQNDIVHYGDGELDSTIRSKKDKFLSDVYNLAQRLRQNLKP
jgi:hypothetical protein